MATDTSSCPIAAPPRPLAPTQPSLHAPTPLTAPPLVQSPQLTRFWFQIESTNQIQCIWAESFTEAKAKAALHFLPQWGKISWLHLDR